MVSVAVNGRRAACAARRGATVSSSGPCSEQRSDVAKMGQEWWEEWRGGGRGRAVGCGRTLHIVVGGGREKRSAGGSEVCERTRSKRREVTLNTRTRVANDDVLE